MRICDNCNYMHKYLSSDVKHNFSNDCLLNFHVYILSVKEKDEISLNVFQCAAGILGNISNLCNNQ